MVFHSFSDWFHAMGNTLQTFRIHERVDDKPLHDLYYRNYVGSEWSVEERFDDQDDDTQLINDSSWAAGGGDSPTATCYAVFLDERGYFHDADNANHNEVVFTFSQASSGAGWSKIRFFIDYPTGNETDSDLIVVVSDAAANILMKFHFLNGKAYIMEGVNNRVLQIAAVDIDPIGEHDIELWFDEDNKKFKIYFDGTESVTSTGFDDYFSVLAGAIVDLGFIGNDACDGLDLYFDNIAIDWIDTSFDAWIVSNEKSKADGAVGVDDLATHVMRVDISLYPIADDLKESDEVIRDSDSQIFKIVKDKQIGRYLNVVRYEIKEAV